MSSLRLCTGTRAVQPYYLNNVCINVYSIEELCYLFMLNPFMITPEIMSKELVNWIETECNLPELSENLRKLFNKASSLSEFVNSILDYVNFCDETERTIINETLRSNSGLNDYERKKNQIDYLLKNGRYELAIEEYEALLNSMPTLDHALRPMIYQNMGYAYVKLFMFDVAAKYYKRAYDMNKDEKTAIMYLCAVRLYLREDKYLKFIIEQPELKDVSLKLENQLNKVISDFETSQESIMLNALSIYKDEGNVSSYYDEIDKVISGMKEDYLKQVVLT